MKKETKKHVIRIVALYGIAILFLTLTDPAKLPSVFLVVPFVIFFFALYYSVLTLIYALRSKETSMVIGLRVSRPRVIAGLVAGLPVLLLLLQSIGQLTARDAITATAIFIVAYFYAIRSSVTFSSNR